MTTLKKEAKKKKELKKKIEKKNFIPTHLIIYFENGLRSLLADSRGK